MRKTVILFITVGVISLVLADGWVKSYGSGSSWACISKIVHCSDSTYIAVGERSMYSEDGDTGAFLWVFKIDNDGNVLWDQIIRREPFEIITARGVAKLPDGDFIIFAEASHHHGFWFVEIDSNGCVVRSEIIPEDSAVGDRYLMEMFTCNNTIVATPDNGFAVAGNYETWLGTEYDPFFLYVRRVWSPFSYTYVWDLATFRIYNLDDGYNDWATSIARMPCGDFLISGTKHFRTWLARIKSDGSIVWENDSLYLGVLTNIFDIDVVDDNHYLLTGQRVDRPALACVDSIGEVLWEKVYDFLPPDSILAVDSEAVALFHSLTIASDGGFAMVGHYGIMSPIWFELAFVMKTDSLGNPEWVVDLPLDTVDGRIGSPDFRSIVATPDGGYMLTGSKTCTRRIAKVDSEGRYYSSVGETTGESKPEAFVLTITPNPFNSRCEIRTNYSGRIDIVDLTGKVVKSFAPAGDGIRVRTLLWRPDRKISSGVYLVKLPGVEREIFYIK